MKDDNKVFYVVSKWRQFLDEEDLFAVRQLFLDTGQTEGSVCVNKRYVYFRVFTSRYKAIKYFRNAFFDDSDYRIVTFKNSKWRSIDYSNKGYSSAFKEIKKGLGEAIKSEGGVYIGTDKMIEQLRELAEEDEELSNFATAVADRLEDLLDYKEMFEDLCEWN